MSVPTDKNRIEKKSVIAKRVEVGVSVVSHSGFGCCQSSLVHYLCDKKKRMDQHWLLGLFQVGYADNVPLQMAWYKVTHFLLIQYYLLAVAHWVIEVRDENGQKTQWGESPLKWIQVVTSAERQFSVLHQTPTSGFSLCVFTASTPKKTDSTLHPDGEQTKQGSFIVKPGGVFCCHNIWLQVACLHQTPFKTADWSFF